MLLAIDPGVTTGVAVKIRDSYITACVKEPADLWQYFNAPYEAVIVETFAAQIISHHGLHTVRLVGGVEALCHHLRLPLYLQPPQRRKAFMNSARNILHAQWERTHTRHEVHEEDALAHMLAWEHHTRARNSEGTGTVVIPMNRKRTNE